MYIYIYMYTFNYIYTPTCGIPIMPGSLAVTLAAMALGHRIKLHGLVGLGAIVEAHRVVMPGALHAWLTSELALVLGGASHLVNQL